MHCPRTTPMAKSEASHMISNGFVQSGAELIGAEISSCLSFPKIQDIRRQKQKARP